jgi:hypothetical protein
VAVVATLGLGSEGRHISVFLKLVELPRPGQVQVMPMII